LRLCRKARKRRFWESSFYAPAHQSARNKREAQHAKSDADFISKIEGSLQELEETAYWLELIEELEFFSSQKLQPIQQETKELTAIFVTIAKKVKEKSK
jgi:four helix bundle protein